MLRDAADCRATQIEEGCVMGNRMTAVGADLVVVGMNQGLRLVRLSLIIFATLGAASCGGGGGERGAPPPSGPSFDLAAGLANLAANEVNATMSVSGTANGFSVTGTAQLTQSAASAATFNGAPASAQTTAVSGTGMNYDGAFPLTYSFIQYVLSSYAILGLDTNFNGVLEYDFGQSVSPFPSSVMAGDTGVLGTMDLSLDSQRDDHAGTIEVSYSVVLDPNNADSVIVELFEEIYTISNNPDQVTQFNYTLTAAGSMSLQSLSITYPASKPEDELFFTVQQ
jgi:hypothetical protein